MTCRVQAVPTLDFMRLPFEGTSEWMYGDYDEQVSTGAMFPHGSERQEATASDTPLSGWPVVMKSEGQGGETPTEFEFGDFDTPEQNDDQRKESEHGD